MKHLDQKVSDLGDHSSIGSAHPFGHRNGAGVAEAEVQEQDGAAAETPKTAGNASNKSDAGKSSEDGRRYSQGESAEEYDSQEDVDEQAELLAILQDFNDLSSEVTSVSLSWFAILYD